MLHEYADMDPDYKARTFISRKELLSSVESTTILPENGLSARSLLDECQLGKVQEIRVRRLSAVIDRFRKD